MTRIRMAEGIIEVPDQTMGFLTERLGSEAFAAAAIRAAKEPAYYRKAQLAAAQGSFPQEVVQLANQLGRMGVQTPEAAPAEPDAMQAIQAMLAGGQPPAGPPMPPPMPPPGPQPMPSPMAPGPVRPRPVSLQMAAPTDPMGFMRSLGLRAG